MKMASLARTLVLVAFSASMLMFSGGCASERLLHTGITPNEDAPEWVRLGALPATDDKIYVVGRSVGVNVLDERAAYDAALAHAAEQVAKLVQTHVSSSLEMSDTRGPGVSSMRRGADNWRHRCPVMDRKLPHFVEDKSEYTGAQASDALVSMINPIETHWERWRLRERPFLHLWWAFRYKCWVLVEIDRQDLEEMASNLQNNSIAPRDRAVFPVVAQ
ncbi:MAG: hypothetical protein JJU36_05155 [Phycisphaeraceae bacterium]|nr:hypothetical protein [Phycisphaeraceae bacterium]